MEWINKHIPKETIYLFAYIDKTVFTMQFAEENREDLCYTQQQIWSISMVRAVKTCIIAPLDLWARRNVELLSDLSLPVESLKVITIYLRNSLLKKHKLSSEWKLNMRIFRLLPREIKVILFDREENELPQREWGIESKATKTSAPVGAKSHPRVLPHHWVSRELMPSHRLLDEWAWHAVCIRTHTHMRIHV